MSQGAATCHVIAVALSPVALLRGCGRCGMVVPRGAAVSCRCRAAARCAAVTAPPPVMSRGAATCRVVAVVLPPMGHRVVVVTAAWSCHGALLPIVLPQLHCHVSHHGTLALIVPPSRLLPVVPRPC